MNARIDQIEERIEACLKELRSLNTRRQTAWVRARRQAVQAQYAALGQELALALTA